MNNQQDMQNTLAGSTRIVRSTHVNCNAAGAIDTLAQALGDDLELVILFVSPLADVDHIIRQAKARFAPAQVVGCTTAGEITRDGYTEGQIVATGFPRSNFRSRLLFVKNLDEFDGHDLIDQMVTNRNEMSREKPKWGSEFTFLLVDGLSTREDALTTQLAVGLGPVPLFGGSAGDGSAFGKTYILHDGKMHGNAAVLMQFRSNCPVSVFKTDHFIPTEQRMVITRADSAARRVQEINAEPAAREYARILGKDPNQLSTMTFAAHPVVVRLGGQHHVRSIQRVADNGDLLFFSAIDEGMVLSLAGSENMVTHLTRELDALSSEQMPDTILACDCVFRKIEAQQNQMSGPISNILAANRVVGFSTYGEQFNSMHANQTLTGVAIYPPKKTPS